MSDTMTDMELIYADLLIPNQIMQGDLIEIDGDIVEVVSIVDDVTGDNYTITYTNDFGEEDEYTCTDEAVFKLFVYSQDETEI